MDREKSTMASLRLSAEAVRELELIGTHLEEVNGVALTTTAAIHWAIRFAAKDLFRKKAKNSRKKA